MENKMQHNCFLTYSSFELPTVKKELKLRDRRLLCELALIMEKLNVIKLD